MRYFLDSFHTNYDTLKLYVLLYPYMSYIDKYVQDPTDISISTNDSSENENIKLYLKQYFTYKNINVATRAN